MSKKGNLYKIDHTLFSFQLSSIAPSLLKKGFQTKDSSLLIQVTHGDLCLDYASSEFKSAGLLPSEAQHF